MKPPLPQLKVLRPVHEGQRDNAASASKARLDLDSYPRRCAVGICHRRAVAGCDNFPSPHDSPHSNHQRLLLHMHQNPAGNFYSMSPNLHLVSSRRKRPADESWQALPGQIQAFCVALAAGHAWQHTKRLTSPGLHIMTPSLKFKETSAPAGQITQHIARWSGRRMPWTSIAAQDVGPRKQSTL